MKPVVVRVLSVSENARAPMALITSAIDAVIQNNPKARANPELVNPNGRTLAP
jgi:hypothetical protein